MRMLHGRKGVELEWEWIYQDFAESTRATVESNPSQACGITTRVYTHSDMEELQREPW